MAEDDGLEGGEGGDAPAVTPEELEQLRADAAEGQKLKLQAQRDKFVSDAKIDPSNPTTELVLDKFWTPETTTEDFKSVAEQYGILVPDKTADTGGDPKPDPPPPVSDYEQDRNSLGGGSGAPDETQPPSLPQSVKTVHDEMMERGGSKEDAMAAAIHANLEYAARQQAAGQRERFRTEMSEDTTFLK